MKDCEDKKPCGCEDEALPSGTPCAEGTVDCPDPEPCAETFDARCIIYTGADITCNDSVIATNGARMSDIILALANCANGEQSSIHRLVPDADSALSGVDDNVISIDRNACFAQVTIAPEAGAPAGILFNYYDQNGVLQSGSANIIMHPSQSTILFSMNVTDVEPGVYNINLIATGCGTSFTIPINFTVV